MPTHKEHAPVSKQPATATPAEFDAPESNPFFIATKGLDRLFKLAMPVAILLVIVSVVGGVMNFVGNAAMPPASTPDRQGYAIYDKSGHRLYQEDLHNNPQPGSTTEDFFNNNTSPGTLATVLVIAALVASVVIAVGLFISFVANGIGDFTSAQLAVGNSVSLSQAFGGVFARFWSYAWLLVLMGIKIFLWSLLLIVPGVIMAVRYRLAGTVFFAEGLRGNAAIQRSVQLTRGGWLTTFSAYQLFNVITFNLLAKVVDLGVGGQLYAQFVRLERENKPKPPAHWLSWLTLIFTLLIVLLVVTLLVLAIVFFALFYQR